MRRAILAVAGASAVLALAGCGGGNDNSTSAGGYGGGGGASTGANGGGGAYGGGGGASTPAGGAGVVSVASTDLGKVIVDSKGFTLYDFHKDKGGKSSCYGGCAAVWSPLTTSGAPKAQGGAQASLLGTTKRSDGSTQVTYAGHPIYTYAGDNKPGDTNGNDISQFGAQWYALLSSGQEPKD